MPTIMFVETKPRTLTKSVTWRLCATLNSYLTLVLIASHSPLLLAIIMNISGFFVFYFFERIWNKVQWGKVKVSYDNSSEHAA